MINDFIRYKARHNYLFRRYMKKFKKYYDLTPSRQVEIKNDKFLRQFKNAITKSVFYKELYHQHGINIDDIKSIDDISKLPVISKNDIKNRIDDVLIGNKLGVVKGYTSGTSGTPLTVYRNIHSIVKENAYHWSYRMSHGLNPRDPKISIRGDLNKDILYQVDKYARTLYLSSYNLNEKNLDKILELIENFKPKALMGYPSSLYILANEFEKRKNVPTVPLAFTSSETLYDFQKEKIEKLFHSRIFDWYGNSERTIAFEQCEYGNYHEVPIYSINEFYDDHLITTGLINDIFPLIRYKVEDVITPGKEKCLCNSQYLTTPRITGRSDDVIKLKDGTLIGSPGVSTSFKDIEGIMYTQLVQNDLEHIDVNLVVEEAFTKKSEEKLIHNIKNRLGPEISLNVNYINESDLLTSRNGKYKLVINKCLED